MHLINCIWVHINIQAQILFYLKLRSDFVISFLKIIGQEQKKKKTPLL
jgi:hypothetical protein